MADPKPNYAVMLGLAPCPKADLHEPSMPIVAFSRWAWKKAETHRPVKCPGCGLYKIWEPRPSEW